MQAKPLALRLHVRRRVRRALASWRAGVLARVPPAASAASAAGPPCLHTWRSRSGMQGGAVMPALATLACARAQASRMRSPNGQPALEGAPPPARARERARGHSSTLRHRRDRCVMRRASIACAQTRRAAAASSTGAQAWLRRRGHRACRRELGGRRGEAVSRVPAAAVLRLRPIASINRCGPELPAAAARPAPRRRPQRRRSPSARPPFSCPLAPHPHPSCFPAHVLPPSIACL